MRGTSVDFLRDSDVPLRVERRAGRPFWQAWQALLMPVFLIGQFLVASALDELGSGKASGWVGSLLKCLRPIDLKSE